MPETRLALATDDDQHVWRNDNADVCACVCVCVRACVRACVCILPIKRTRRRLWSERDQIWHTQCHMEIHLERVVGQIKISHV